jgi:hypothetical protein
MTDPCNSALLLVSPGASPPYATIVGMIFRISTQRASPSPICQPRLFPVDLLSLLTCPRRNTHQWQDHCSAEASALPTLTPKHPPLSWPEDCYSARLRPAREAMGSSNTYLVKQVLSDITGDFQPNQLDSTPRMIAASPGCHFARSS